MKSRLETLCRFLETGLVERTVPARLALLAAISGEHLLLIGPPGTAKSELARKLHKAFDSFPYFERLLTRFSVPEELFGPLSIRALEQDRYQRLTEHYLPQASIAFIDEIFKANSAILNALLTLLNEREFDNGSTRVKTPLICVLGASNELPEDDSLLALYDRFLLRYHVVPVSDEQFAALLDLDQREQANPDDADRLQQTDIDQIRQQSARVHLSAEARQLLLELRAFLQQQNIIVSDRRWLKMIGLLKTSAASNGNSQVSVWDCSLLVHCVWQAPEQQAAVIAWFLDYFQLDTSATRERFEKLVSAWEQRQHTDSERRTQKTNKHGAALYMTPEGDITTHHERVRLAERDHQVLYLAPPTADHKDRSNNGRGYTLEELEHTFFDDSYRQTHIDGKWVDLQNYINNTQNRLVERTAFDALTEPCYFSREYVANSIDDVQHVVDEIDKLHETCSVQLAQLGEQLNHHLWLKGGYLQQAEADMKQQLVYLLDFRQRLEKVFYAIKQLPVNDPSSLAGS